MQTEYKITTIEPGDKFVACWGYDQTQYSIYTVEKMKSKFVYVTGQNGWSNFSDSQLSEGSQVKVYKYKYWTDLTEEERKDYESRGFDWSSYQHHYGKDNLTDAKIKTIAKVNRINKQAWTYIWTFTDGSTYSSEEKLNVEQIKAVKKCLINVRWGKPSIKIDSVITATLDKEYEGNAERYAEQNLYTAYNGR